MSINATAERPGTLRGRLAIIPWLTVVPLAVVMAYADGFWVSTLRGAAGSIERTGQPFETWLRESTLLLPVFVLAVLGALALAARWFGVVLRKPKTVVATTLLVVAAGTLIGIVALAASSAYDYQLHSDLMHQMGSSNAMASMDSPSQPQASLGLQSRAVGLGGGIILVTNLALVSWIVAIRGGRLVLSKTKQ